MATKRFGHIFVIIFAVLSSLDLSASASDGVLPKTIVPIQYDLAVLIDTDSLSYSVNETVQLDVQRVSPNISFHATWNVNWTNVILTCGQQKLQVKTHSSNHDVITITFAKDLAIGNCTLDMNFNTKMSLNATQGIYVSPNSHNIITEFQSNLTHNVFPCFDEPHFKAKFVLTIHHSENYTALSNTKQLKSTCSNATRLCITRFPESLPMALSSFGFSLTLDKAYSRDAASINYRVFGPIENKDVAYKWAIDFSSNALAKAQQWFGRNYQLPKIDFQSVQNLSTTMINSWGLIKIREPFLYSNASNTFAVPIEMHQKSAQAIVDGILSSWLEHEVTPNGDEATFLTQGLSTYIQYLILDQVEPEWKIMDQFVVRELQRSLANATLECGTISALERSAASSASIIRMMASLVGANVFQNAVRRYLNDSSMNTVLPVHLFNATQVEVNKERVQLPATVQKIFTDWFKMRNAVPSINISRLYDNSSTTVVMHVGPVSLKFIPISFASASKPVPDQILWPSFDGINKSYKIDANDSQWLLVNNKATGGYYRVLYDNKNWQLLIEQLKGKNYRSIHAANRAQLIDDAAHFAQNGLLSYDIVFELLTYLQTERDFIPWASAKKSLEFFDRMLRNSEVHRHFEVFIQKITVDAYPELSIKNQKEQNYVKRLERLSVTKLACEAGVPICITEVDKMTPSIFNKTQYIVPELQQLIFCAASRYIMKPKSSFQKALTRHIMSMIRQKNRTEDGSMTRAINGLGCTRNYEIINKTLDLTTVVFPPEMNIKIRASDREILFKAIAVGSNAGTKAALEFMDQNYAEMNRLFVSLPSILDTIAPYITSSGLSSLLGEFEKNHQSKFDVKMRLAVASAKAKAKINQEWMARNYDGISKWLIANIKVPNSGAASSTINVVLFVAVTLIAFFLCH